MVGSAQSRFSDNGFVMVRDAHFPDSLTTAVQRKYLAATTRGTILGVGTCDEPYRNSLPIVRLNYSSLHSGAATSQPSLADQLLTPSVQE
jgi:hypothetical protein